MGWCEWASIQSAVSTARRRSRAGGFSGRRVRPAGESTRRPASSSPTSSTPIALRPVAAACASSPSTIMSARGGRHPACHASVGTADRVDERRVEVERQALVAADVVVGAHVLVARVADEKRARDELVRAAAEAVAEAAVADVAHAERVMPLDKRCVAGSGLAPVVEDRNRRTIEDGSDGHAGRVPFRSATFTAKAFAARRRARRASVFLRLRDRLLCLRVLGDLCGERLLAASE